MKPETVPRLLGALLLLVALSGCPSPARGGGTGPAALPSNQGEAPASDAGADIAQIDAATAASDSAPLADAAASGPCVPCVADDECATGEHCAQILGSSYCASACPGGLGCPVAAVCALVSGTGGEQIQVCVPPAATCGGEQPGPEDSTSAAQPDAAAAGQTCAGYDDPATPSCCTCGSTGNCAANGCYNKWLCNTKTCKCNPAPDVCSAGSDAGSSVPDAADSAVFDSGGEPANLTNQGGTMDTLAFAIVGDTRPPFKNGTSLYPTAIVSKIWKAVEAESPHPEFTVTTGDYQFSSANGATAAAQLDLYLDAAKGYTGKVFYALGNHECTGATASNCGAGAADGLTQTYQIFLQKMLAPLGQKKPYYALNFADKKATWTAKFLFVAANAWSAEQAAWLESQLQQPTTYTLVVRHESSFAPEAPGVTPSQQLLQKYPYTLILAGHTHTVSYSAAQRQVIVGNGGAPLATAVNYGYAIIRQRPDMALEFNAYDYQTHAVLLHFAVKPNGNPAP